LSEKEARKDNGKRILLPLCLLLAIISVASVGLYAYQSFNPTTVTTTQTATSFQTETSVSVSVWTSVSYATVTTAIGTTTALYGSAPCYGGYCTPYESQFNNYCYSANSVGTQCTLYGFVQASSNGCILLSVPSGYNNNIYYALTNWQSSYPTFGYVTVNGYISGPSSNCSAIGFYVNSIHQ
jgi:hypothetical protein